MNKSILKTISKEVSSVPDNIQVLSSKDAIVLDVVENFGIIKNRLTDNYELSDGTPLTDCVLNSITLEARAINDKIVSSSVREVIFSNRTPSYHPFELYLHSIKNLDVKEGTISAFLDCLVLDNHHPDYKERIVKKWFGGIMGTLLGSYSVMTLVLIGGQGCGKTSFFRSFLPDMLKEYFVEGEIKPEKDIFSRLCSNLIYYNDEFTSKNKTEASVYKNISSSDKFTYRPPYGKIDVARPRTAILCGSANEPDVISDHTGNRRILATRIKHINHQALSKINIDDLYRELLELCKENPTWWHLSKDDIAFMNKDTAENTAVDEFEERVLKWTQPDNNSHVSATEVSRHIAAYDGSFRPNINKLSRALTKVYGTSFQKKINGRNSKGYSLKLVSNDGNGVSF